MGRITPELLDTRSSVEIEANKSGGNRLVPYVSAVVRTWRRWGRAHWAAAFSLLLTAEATALVLAEGPANRNRDRPHPVVGWSGACMRGGLSAVHLGEGWILTAAHVGPGSVRIGDEDFAPIPDSQVDLAGTSHRIPDLTLFRVSGSPAGPRIRIASAPPRSGERVVLMGAGGVRGERFAWGGLSGFRRARSRGLQWGENRVAKVAHRLTLERYVTTTFAVEFDDFYRLPEEAIAVEGDSGGPVFRIGEQGAELLGILVATSRGATQPSGSVVFGAHSFAADLTHYRDQIESARRGTGGCGRGFAQAALMVSGAALVGRRRRSTTRSAA